MNLKTFIFMMLTFREIYQIPRNIQTYLSIMMWMILWINIKTDNENKKDRVMISYPSIIM